MRAHGMSLRARLDTVLTALRQRLALEERGVSTVEYIGLGAVAVAIVTAVATAIEGSDIGNQIVTAIGQMIQDAIGGGD